MGCEVRVAANGRMVIPLEMRKALGIAEGGSVLLEMSDTGLTLRSRQQRVMRARELGRRMVAKDPALTLENFLAERAEDRRLEFEAEKRHDPR